jgi:hypothetical protein
MAHSHHKYLLDSMAFLAQSEGGGKGAVSPRRRNRVEMKSDEQTGHSVFFFFSRLFCGQALCLAFRFDSVQMQTYNGD